MLCQEASSQSPSDSCNYLFYLAHSAVPKSSPKKGALTRLLTGKFAENMAHWSFFLAVLASLNVYQLNPIDKESQYVWTI